MGKLSKTGAKASAAAAKAAKARAPAPKRIDRGMRKLLAKNERKRKNREARKAKAIAAAAKKATAKFDDYIEGAVLSELSERTRQRCFDLEARQARAQPVLQQEVPIETQEAA